MLRPKKNSFCFVLDLISKYSLLRHFFIELLLNFCIDWYVTCDCTLKKVSYFLKWCSMFPQKLLKTCFFNESNEYIFIIINNRIFLEGEISVVAISTSFRGVVLKFWFFQNDIFYWNDHEELIFSQFWRLKIDGSNKKMGSRILSTLWPKFSS